MLVVHLVSAGAWIGLDVVLAILVFTALLTDDVRTAAVSYQALRLFAVWPLSTIGLVCLASGITLGLGTRYGLVRYWWVAAKLAINIVFVALVPLALRPAVSEAAAYGRQLTDGALVTLPTTDLLFPPIVSPAGLLLAVILAVYKPWGRIRKGARSSARAPAKASGSRSWPEANRRVADSRTDSAE
ncbi:hypothetical protein [Prauserella alba]|uniref:DUF2269 domain-containing protein n=1 Tax=Prauserella alba TaxID=176898 RepID=A0ABP4FQX1_9PSEU|nr:hypothetical protein [Prauserella alba]